MVQAFKRACGHIMIMHMLSTHVMCQSLVGRCNKGLCRNLITLLTKRDLVDRCSFLIITMKLMLMFWHQWYSLLISWCFGLSEWCHSPALCLPEWPPICCVSTTGAWRRPTFDHQSECCYHSVVFFERGIISRYMYIYISCSLEQTPFWIPLN